MRRAFNFSFSINQCISAMHDAVNLKVIFVSLFKSGGLGEISSTVKVRRVKHLEDKLIVKFFWR